MIEMHSHRFNVTFLLALVGVLGLSACHKSVPGSTKHPVQDNEASQGPPAVDLYVAGAAAYQNGEKDKAAEELSQAVHQNPDSIMSRQLLARIYLEKNDYAKAADQLESLTTLDPYTQPNFYYLGYCQQLLNELPQAKASYKQALALDPKDAKAATNLGVVYLSLNQGGNAVKALDLATHLDDKSWYAWDNLGIALDLQGQAADAEQAFRRSLELDPSQSSTIYDLGSNLLSQGRNSEAVPVLQELVKHDDSLRAHRKLAEALGASNDLKGSITEYERIVQLDARDYQTMNKLALMLVDEYEKEAEFDDDKKNRALGLWRQSLAISPNQADVKELLKKWGGK